jgi:nitrate reductase molybdenum cofactor assembly chaperone NarJ/NarW
MSGVYSLFADVLDYPCADVFAQAGLLAERVDQGTEAADLLRRFEANLRGKTLGELQEVYTASFDMRPDCTPNLGCHLFGEDVRRNLFMAQLKERMVAHKVESGVELPDHFSLVLRLLDSLTDEDERLTLVEDCLLPGVNRILSALSQGCLYADVLQALIISLKNEARAGVTN